MSRIAIVGGGVAGLSAAAALSDHGHEVLVFEAERQLGYHASGRSAALFDENYGNDTVRALNTLTRPALDQMGVLSSRGALVVAKAEDISVFQADLDRMSIAPIAIQEARRLVPILSPSVQHAGFCAAAQDIDTDALLQGFARHTRGNGVQINTSARVEALTEGWMVKAGGAECNVDCIVNAAGAWADDIAEMAGLNRLGLQPLRRSMARLPAPGGHDVSDWPMVLGAGESWYAKPDAGAWIVSPADEDPVLPMDAWADDLVLAEGLARYEGYVTEPVMRVLANWAGLRTFAPDRSLVIGEDPDRRGFFWLAGQGGYGFQTSVGAATHLSSLISGHASPVDDHVAAALSPARFL